MKAVLMSIQPKWCELIASGKKTVEIRKTVPKLETPFKVYIYMTAGDAVYPVTINGTPYTCSNVGGMCVIGEFVCDKIDKIEIRHFTVFGHENVYAAVGENPDNQWLKHSCLSYSEVVQYGKLAPLHGLHISDLVIYDKPKAVREFSHTEEYINNLRNQVQHWEYGIDDELARPLRRPPQSWCYVAEIPEVAR